MIPWRFIRAQWPSLLVAAVVLAVWFRIASLDAALEAEREKVAALEISLTEAKARVEANQVAIGALTLTTERRRGAQTQTAAAVDTLQAMPEGIPDVESSSPAIDWAFDRLSQSPGTGSK